MTDIVEQCCVSDKTHVGYNRHQPWHFTMYCRVHAIDTDIEVLLPLDEWDRCGKPMLSGWCLMDKGHRGRHTTQVHYCDTCDKHRRGAHAFSQLVNPHDGVVEAEQCWFCHQVMGPIWEREQYALMDEEMRREMSR